MSAQTCREKTFPAVPCHVNDPDLWFAESPMELERAKLLWTPTDNFEATLSVYASQDYVEGRSAFAAKRKPNFVGR